jgi:K+-sensing histidine kinase KdpD
MRKTQFRGYLVAIAAVAAATLIRLPLQPLLGSSYIFILFFFALVIAGIRGGLGPSILALGLSVASSTYFFIPPIQSLAAPSPRDLLGIGLFVMAGIGTIALTEKLRRATLRAEQAAQSELAKQRRLELLSKAGAALNASLDVQATLQALADIMVEAMADVCSVYLLNDDGKVKGCWEHIEISWIRRRRRRSSAALGLST